MTRLILSACFLTLVLGLASTPSIAQDTGGETSSGSSETSGGNSGGAPGSQGDIQENLSLDTSIPEISIPEFDDGRNQGFVGATSSNIQEFGFVGGISQFVGGATEGSFGGDFDSGSGGGSTGGRGGNAGFAGGNANGFEIVRPKYIRTRLRLNFDAPTIAGSTITGQFKDRLKQLPAVGENPAVTVSINNRIATITGNTSSREEAVRIERQLRLEPGVSRVVNKLKHP